MFKDWSSTAMGSQASGRTSARLRLSEELSVGKLKVTLYASCKTLTLIVHTA